MKEKKKREEDMSKMATTTRDDDDDNYKCLPGDMDFSFIDLFYTKTFFPPPCFKVKRVTEDDLFLEQVKTPVNPWDDRRYPDMKLTIKNKVAFTLWRWPEEEWGLFRYIDNSANIKHAIRVAATLLLTLLTNDMLYISANYPKYAAQLNQLWEQLSDLWEQRASLQDACNLIMELLTTDRETYSWVTETDVSQMLHWYSVAIRPPASFCRPYRPSGSGNQLDQDQWFKDIMEVVDSIESPPILKADDYTRLVMKILTRQADGEYLLSKVKLDIFPYSGQECLSDLLKMAFDHLLLKVISTVDDWMMIPLVAVLRPLYKLYGMHVPPEIAGLIRVAEVRRIALGSRFISRNHLLWAFYECGLVLPPQIRKMIKFNSADENHPPYHIYLASMKLAERFREKLRLENFIFAVIHSKDIGVSGDQMINMELCYEDFLTALDPSSVFHPRDVGALPRIPKRLHSGEFKS